MGQITTPIFIVHINFRIFTRGKCHRANNAGSVKGSQDDPENDHIYCCEQKYFYHEKEESVHIRRLNYFIILNRTQIHPR